MNDNTIIHHPDGHEISRPQTDKIWDLSTAHITYADARLMTPETSLYCVAEVPSLKGIDQETAEALYGNKAYGSILYVAQEDKEDCKEMLLILAEEGFSKSVLDIMHMAFLNDIRYVRFDCDGDTVKGLKTYEW